MRCLPADAAELVELGLAAVPGAVAGEQLDVLHRQVELVAAGVADLQAVVRMAERGDGGEAVEAADAVVGVHDKVADGEARCLGDEIGGAARLAARSGEAVAQDVLLGDDGEVGRLEALLQAQHRIGCRACGQRQRLGVGLHLVGVGEVVLGEQRRQPLARAGREGGEDDAPALALQAAHVGDGGLEHVAALAGALRREHPAGAALHGAHRAPHVGLLERRQIPHQPAIEARRSIRPR